MRLNFTTSWIFQGWITLFVLALYAQKTFAKSIQCGLNQYQTKGSKCCDLCGPGFRLNIECSGSKETKCLKCNPGEYQPGWTQEKRCFQQSTCDGGKGFVARSENPQAEVPCKCRAGLQCSLINCEYCEALPQCHRGFGLEPDLESATGRRACVPCKRGFFSNEANQEPCKPWESCKSLGRSELQPGDPQNDAVCGDLLTGGATSWVIVSVLSVITILSLLILLLFCYKDKLKLLSVNLRSCVQNLKRTRIQQETLAPLYHSGARTLGAGATGVGPGEPNYIMCETTNLICQAPHSLPAEPPYPGLTRGPSDDTKVYMLCTAHTEVSEQGREQEVMSLRRKLGAEEGSQGSGEPEEVSDDEGGGEEKGKQQEEEKEEEEAAEGDGPSLMVGSCVCVPPAQEPLEVGENEDCSQAVSHEALSACSCGGGGQGRGRDQEGARWREEGSEVKSRAKVGGGENSESSGSSLIHTNTPTVRVPSVPPHTQTQTRTRPEHKPHPSERPRVQSLETIRLTSTDSDATKTSAPSTAFVPPSPPQPAPLLMFPLPAGDLYLGKTHEAPNTPEWSQGVSWGPSGGNKLLSGGLDQECPPESLQSQLAEPDPTSGQVTGNHNTTFISNGQVMNFSGDVIVVYVSQSSAGEEEGAEPGAAFGSPVQEQANGLLRSCQRQHHGTPGDSITQNGCHASTLPVQEVMADWLRGK